MSYDRNKRADKLPGVRGVYESHRKKILAAASVCAICGRPLDKSLKYPDPMSPTVDHIIPIAKGGHPTDLNNLQAAHRCCNRAKSDRLAPLETFPEEATAFSNRDLPLSCDWAHEDNSPDIEELHARGYELYADGVRPRKPGTGSMKG